METILKLHPNNIAQLKGHIKAKGPSTIHGDGNIYPAMKDWSPESGKMNHSHNNAVFSNSNREEATYHKTYDTIDEVPDTIEQLQDELIAARFNKSAQERAEQGKVVSNTFEAYDDGSEKAAKEAAAQAAKEEKAAKAEAEKAEKAAKAEEEKAAKEAAAQAKKAAEQK